MLCGTSGSKKKMMIPSRLLLSFTLEVVNRSFALKLIPKLNDV